MIGTTNYSVLLGKNNDTKKCEINTHRTIPKDHTSDFDEKIKSSIDSIAIHLTGRGPCNNSV